MSLKARPLIATAGVLAAVVILVAQQTPRTKQVLSPAPEFPPDTVFKGSSLTTGFQTIGNATWKAQNGEITGTPTTPDGGWLMMDHGFQDVQYFTRFKCDAACDAGVLMRAEKTPAGYSGVLVSLKEGDLNSYQVTLDSNGKFLTRDLIKNTTWGTIRTGGAPAAPGGGGGRGAAGGGNGAAGGRAGRGGGGNGPGGAGPGDFMAGINLPVPLPELEPPAKGLGKQPNGEWDQMDIIFDSNIVRPHLNNTNQMAPSIIEDSSGYGNIALYVAGTAPVHYKDIAYRDLAIRVVPPEHISTRFRMQRLEEYSYGWGAAMGDFNRDGNIDLTAGPYIYYGPDFTRREEVFLGAPANPNGYVANMVTHVADVNGDGWPDILATENRAVVVYINPKGEHRRWERYPAAPIGGETSVLKDIDGDGRPDLVGTVQNAMAYATYDPEHPTAPWTVHKVSATGLGYGHSGGACDINGDGKVDILGTAGWWENPGKGAGDTMWAYHPVAFGRWGRSQSAGGGEIMCYDVNGDGLMDVVSSLHGHGWGLAWFEQKKSPTGEITFVRHMIMDNFSTENAGGVTFAELHGLTIGDIDGDGIPDIITGKRYWSHQDSYFDPYSYGEPVLYWYRTVRNKNAPGGAEFVPELIHNRSGVGSQILAGDFNKDGAIDILTSTNRGTFIFFGKPHGK